MIKMKGKEFYLDWKKDYLEGWESHKSSLLIASMIEGIKSNQYFPHVYVVKVEDNFYRLARGRRFVTQREEDGGHHRAVAHYIEGSSLRCFLLEDPKISAPDWFFSIGSIRMGEYVNQNKIKDSLNRLPRDIAEKFCLENRLSVRDFLSQ